MGTKAVAYIGIHSVTHQVAISKAMPSARKASGFIPSGGGIIMHSTNNERPTVRPIHFDFDILLISEITIKNTLFNDLRIGQDLFSSRLSLSLITRRLCQKNSMALISTLLISWPYPFRGFSQDTLLFDLFLSRLVKRSSWVQSLFYTLLLHAVDLQGLDSPFFQEQQHSFY